MKEYKIDLSGYEGKVREVVSEAVQRHAFELGYKGFNGRQVASHTSMPFLFLNTVLKGMGYLSDCEASYFEQHEMQEISPADFLALTPEDVQDAPKEPELKPFDRVLVRDDCDGEWRIDFFEGMNKDKDETYRYLCLNSFWRHCIPYEGNEHLLGTKEDVK
jgi:hypothetical protein